MARKTLIALLVSAVALTAFLYPEYRYRNRVTEWKAQIAEKTRAAIQGYLCVTYRSNGMQYPPTESDVYEKVLKTEGYEVSSQKFFGYGFDFILIRSGETDVEKFKCLSLEYPAVGAPFFKNRKTYETLNGELYSKIFGDE